MDLPQELREELEVACMDAVAGDPPGPAVAARLERVCKATFLRLGYKGVIVKAQSDRTGTRVTLLLPAPKATVQKVVLKLH